MELKKTNRDFKTERKGSEKNPKKTLEINNIITILTILSEKSKMPLVLASSEQLQRCPKTLGFCQPQYLNGRDVHQGAVPGDFVGQPPGGEQETYGHTN